MVVRSLRFTMRLRRVVLADRLGGDEPVMLAVTVRS
jgi:hypothetical protein